MKIDTAHDEEGQLELFVVVDDRVHTSKQVGSETEWTDWQRLDGAAADAIRAGRDRDGRRTVFATNSSEGTFLNRGARTDADGDANEWGGWRRLGSERPGAAIAVAANDDGTLEVFVTDPADGTFHARQSSPNDAAWSDWERRGDRGGDEIVLDRTPDGRLEAFLLKHVDDERASGLTTAEKEFQYGVHHCWQRDPGGSSWSDWHRRGMVNGHSLAVARNEDGRVELFLVRDDAVPVYFRQRDETEWTETWEELSYPEDFEVFHRPKARSIAVARSRGRLEGFITGRTLHHLSQTSLDDEWSMWEKFGRIRSADVHVARTPDDRLVVFALEDARRRSGAKLHYRWQTEPGGGWSKWHSREVTVQ